MIAPLSSLLHQARLLSERDRGPIVSRTFEPRLLVQHDVNYQRCTIYAAYKLYQLAAKRRVKSSLLQLARDVRSLRRGTPSWHTLSLLDPISQAKLILA